MLVYGDHAERATTRSRLQELALTRRRLLVMPRGLPRHAALVDLFVDMAGLSQGIADALFDKEGADRRSDEQNSCMAMLMTLAEAVRTSWDSDFESLSPLPEINVNLTLPPTVEIRQAEGYAFYALYPEAYIDAARRLACHGPIRIIGIRSIGTGLAALVATTLAAPAPITLRPVGRPFDRRLAIAPALGAELLGDPAATHVIVDEGPGMSGSSFGTVADFLEDGGVPPARIAFLSGHSGDLGPHASVRHRCRWATARREAADVEALLTEHLPNWVADRIGPLDAPLERLSSEGWRRRFWHDEADWPAANPMWERRKMLARVGGETSLLKFTGLGAAGRRKLARARMLHAAGFVPEPLGLVHGFLVERYIEQASPVDVAHTERASLLHFVGHYLGFRARMFAAGTADGASLAELLDMARFNATQAIGAAQAAALDDWLPMLPRLEARTSRVETDNRCLAHEWLRLPDGRLLKTDALDHHAAHDLIGCQDIAWDVAGAAIELGLPAVALAAAVSEAAGRRVDEELTAFFTLCYLAFQTGSHRLAATMLDDRPREKARNEAAAGRYVATLGPLLARRAVGLPPDP